MKESEQAHETLIRAYKISRRYLGSDATKVSSLVGEIIELVAFARQDAEPDEPMPDAPPEDFTESPEKV